MNEINNEQVEQVGGGFAPLSGPPGSPFPGGGIDPFLWDQLQRLLEQQNQHNQMQ